MGKVTIKAPVTIFDASKNQYVAPGTEVELDEHEALSLIGRHGEFGGAAPMDPGSTHMRLADNASIDSLNTQASINKGHGVSSVDWSKASKAELATEATRRGIDIPEGATKPQLLDLLEKKHG